MGTGEHLAKYRQAASLARKATKRLTRKTAREGLSLQARLKIKSKCVPNRFLRRYRQAMLHKSLTSAVYVFCLECCGWSAKEVDNCMSGGCPLYLFRRPFKMLVAHEGCVPDNLKGRIKIVPVGWSRHSGRGKRKVARAEE